MATLAPRHRVAATWSTRWIVGVLVLMVIMEIANISEVAAQYTKPPLFKTSMALGVVAVVFALRDPAARARLNRWTAAGVALVGVYLAGQLIAMVGTVDLTASKGVLWRSAVDVIYLLIILVLTQTTGKPWTVATAVAATLAVLSILTIVNYLSGGHQMFGGLASISQAKGQLITTQRFGGPYGDSNFWGRLLVLGLPMGWALAQRSRRAGKQLLGTMWLLSTVPMVIAVYLTQSRGTLLVAGLAVVLWFIASGRPAKLALIPAAVAVAFVIPGIGNRILALGSDLFGAERKYDIDPSVLGRQASQEMAWQMFQQRPVFGFGPATFGGQVPYYTDRVATAVHEGLVAPHNLYAQLLAESGLVGLITWLIMVGGVFTILALRISSDPASMDRALAAATLTGVVTWSVASIFLHLAYFRSFAIVLGLACALGPAQPVPTAIKRRMLRTTATWMVAATAGAAAAGVTMLTRTTPAVQAAQKAIVVPAGRLDGWASYAMNVRARMAFLPTMAEVMYNTDAPAKIDVDPVRGILTFTVTGSDGDAAKRNLANALAVARTRIDDNVGHMQYGITAITDVQLERVSLRSKVTIAYAAAWGLIIMMLTRLSIGFLAGRFRAATTEPPIEAAAEAEGARA